MQTINSYKVNSCLLIVIGIFFTFIARAGEYGNIEKKKSVIKIYDVTAKDNLMLDNQFGQVKINLWDKNEIRVDISITANANSDDRAKEYLDGVVIEDKKDGNQIHVKSPDLKPHDQIVVQGMGFIRVAEIAAFGGAVTGHSH